MNILRTNPGNARNMRILGLDYGSKTVGVAVSDPLGLTAQKARDDMAQTGKQASANSCKN